MSTALLGVVYDNPSSNSVPYHVPLPQYSFPQSLTFKIRSDAFPPGLTLQSHRKYTSIAPLSYRSTSRLVTDNPSNPSPETAPTNVMLAQVLKLRRLDDELVDLRDDVQLLASLEVPAVELLRDPVQNLDGARVLYLGRVLVLLLLSVDPVGAVGQTAWRDDRRISGSACSRKTTSQGAFVINADSSLGGAQGRGVCLQDRWAASAADLRTSQYLVPL